MDVEYFNEVVFEKLKGNTKGIVLELSNGNPKYFSKEDVEGCSVDHVGGDTRQNIIFCIGDWCFDITHIIGICYVNPHVVVFSDLKEMLSEDL